MIHRRTAVFALGLVMCCVAITIAPHSARATAGDVFAKNAYYGALTYTLGSAPHPAYSSTRFGPFGPSVDINGAHPAPVGTITGSMANEDGWPLYAPEDGRVDVAEISPGRGWGNAIVWTNTSGTERLFMAHLKRFGKKGTVTAGDIIGYIGNSPGYYSGGKMYPHLHIQAQRNKKPAPLTLSGVEIVPFQNYNSMSLRHRVYRSSGPLKALTRYFVRLSNVDDRAYVQLNDVATPVAQTGFRGDTGWVEITNQVQAKGLDTRLRFSLWNETGGYAYRWQVGMIPPGASGSPRVIWSMEDGVAGTIGARMGDLTRERQTVRNDVRTLRQLPGERGTIQCLVKDVFDLPASGVMVRVYPATATDLTGPVNAGITDSRGYCEISVPAGGYKVHLGAPLDKWHLDSVTPESADVLSVRAGRCLQVSAGQSNRRRLTKNPSSEIYPDISGDKVVWLDVGDGSLENSNRIMVHDLVTGETKPVVVNDQVFLYRGPVAIEGANVVYNQQTAPGSYVQNLWVHNLDTGLRRSITTHEVLTHDSSFRTPAVDGDYVAWAGVSGIHLTNLKSGADQLIASPDWGELNNPRISSRWVVWKKSSSTEPMFAYDRQTATTRRTQFIPAKVGIGMSGSTVLFFGNAGEEIGQNPYGWYVGNIESGAYAFLGSYTELGIEDVYDLVSDTLAVVRCYREDGIGYDVGTYDLTTGELQVISGGVHNTSWTSCDAGRVVWTGQESEADLWDIYLTTLREW